MSTGTWDPDAVEPPTGLMVDDTLRERLLALGRPVEQEPLETQLSGEERDRLAGLMRLDHSLWEAQAADMDERDILDLIRFFAVAENLAGWEAGPQSPVIPLARALRKRGVKLEKGLLRWLRAVNDNRFLPYGPL